MKYNYLIYLSLLTIITFFSCEGTQMIEDFDEEKFAYDYFPLEVGKTWIYAIDSIIYDDEGASVRETSSQVKEIIIEKYEDATGDEIYRLERYWRANDTLNWLVTDVWTAYSDKSKAFRTEENLKFIKFVFPPSERSRWDSNIYFDNNTVVTVAGESLNMFAGWDDAKIESLDQPEEVGGKSYDKVATVLLTDDEGENTIERRYALEKYARGAGLIYKEYEILDSQCSSCTGTWAEKAEKGFILKQTLLEHY